METLRENLTLINWDRNGSKRKYNVLLWGYSSLEYTIAVHLKKSPFLNNLYIANSSEAIKQLGINIDFHGSDIIERAKELKIDIFFCNSGDNILGIVDKFKEAGILCVGVNRKWSLLEASKFVGKKFCKKYNIPHPKFSVVNKIEDFEKEILNFNFPVVIKADGYSRGAGVFICENYDDAKEKTKAILNKSIITATSRVIIEEFIEGKETSFMQFWDGKHLLSFPPIHDYKKLLDGDVGVNTGGMASYCPQKLSLKQKWLLIKYSKKIEQILKKEKANFVGFIYSGIMFSKDNLFVLEYNMRLGSPEGIALIENLDCDFLKMIIFAVKQKLNKFKIKYKKGTSFALRLACKDYPFSSEETVILKRNLLQNIEAEGVSVYYETGIFSNVFYKKQGDFVLTLACNSALPFEKIYNVVNKINVNDFIYRKDIHN